MESGKLCFIWPNALKSRFVTQKTKICNCLLCDYFSKTYNKVSFNILLLLHVVLINMLLCFCIGTYERSCFGSSIEALVYISVPVREIPVGRLMELVRVHSVKHWSKQNITCKFYL
jgi:hypothetical protein